MQNTKTSTSTGALSVSGRALKISNELTNILQGREDHADEVILMSRPEGRSVRLIWQDLHTGEKGLLAYVDREDVQKIAPTVFTAMRVWRQSAANKQKAAPAMAASGGAR